MDFDLHEMMAHYDAISEANYTLSLEALEPGHGSQIKVVFEDLCSHVVVNPLFLKKLVNLEAGFVNKKQEHIEFFGGTLTGVQVVRFTTEDRDRLFSDILEVNDADLEDRLYALKDQGKQFVINREWKISSDVFNISIIWLLHAIEQSKYLTPAQKDEGKIRACQYLIYKFVTSLLYRYFPYPADPEIAAATYAQLSYKFALKSHGSWGAVIRHLATMATSRQGIHAKTIERLDSDYGITLMLNDIQGRPRDILKNYSREFHLIRERGGRIARSSSVVETDGEAVLRDKTKGLGNYTRYLKSVMPDHNSLVREDLLEVIVKIMHTMPERMLRQSLQWASDNFGHTKEQTVERAIDLIAEHAFAYLSEHRELLRASSDLASLITKLRGAYMSSRSTDPKLLEIRDLVNTIVAQATKSKNDSAIAATRTGFMVYLIVRMFSMRHYTS